MPIKKNNTVKELAKAKDLVDKVEKLPQEERQIVLEKLEIYQGDMPHPDILKGYNQLYPKAAEMIIQNGIRESEHRRKMEERYLAGNLRSHQLGQFLGFIIALVIVAGGVFLIYKNHPITGTLLSGTTAVGVVGLFTGNKEDKNDTKNLGETS
ncbi:DUF2335 domain-containing protein [Streptococcus sciuri]|uniref:DUF2335 domain-containing protein n=1 Tax=Streptococcus sciuri TaxID=2973939 RepID=A0ABT2F7G2_9STRE|nr:DUF2335 domain-containing protein [Streptococcus sciuri]MCS4488388.1 DUF2335 domain-containing protein [Streptococcus sciuri]